jgi:hypothetical protein
MQDLKEGDSVTINSDLFDINGKIGTIRNINYPLNRCVVVLESGETYHLPLNQVNPRSFLAG